MDSHDIALIVIARIYYNKDKYYTYEFKSFSSVIMLENIKKKVIDICNIKKNVESLKIFAGNNRNEKIRCDNDIIINSNEDDKGNLLCNINILLYEEQKENEKEKKESDNSKNIIEENKRLKEEIEKLKEEKAMIENQRNNISKEFYEKTCEFNEIEEKYKEKIKNLIESKNNKNKELKDEMEGIMTVNFVSPDESIFCSIPCRNTYKFDYVVKKFYEIYPEYKEFKDNSFYIKNSRINKNKSLEENGIDNNSLITFKEN